MEQVSATRTELLTKKSQVAMAEQGASLLRGKREALVREFLSEVELFAKSRSDMKSDTILALRSLMKSVAIDGIRVLKTSSFSVNEKVEVNVEEKNIWGAKVADVKRVVNETQIAKTLNYESNRIVETKDAFTILIDHFIKIAPLERKLKILGNEIKKTSRRVNALEQRLVPKLNDDIHFIRNALDQREKEDIFRLKKLKMKHVK